MFSGQVRLARQLLGLNQTHFAYQLGWTTKRNVVNLEDNISGKNCTHQTALAIECLLRRSEKWGIFIMLEELKQSLKNQAGEIRKTLETEINNGSYKIISNNKNGEHLSVSEIVSLQFFQENDLVDTFLSENDSFENEFNREDLRDLQHTEIMKLSDIIDKNQDYRDEA